jgi:hypothetical protein
MGQSYVAFVSSCDGFAAFVEQTADHTAVDHFQGISQFWQPGLPTHLPASWKERVRANPEVTAYDYDIAKATDNATRDQLKRERQNAIKRLEQASLKMHRSEVFNIHYDANGKDIGPTEFDSWNYESDSRLVRLKKGEITDEEDFLKNALENFTSRLAIHSISIHAASSRMDGRPFGSTSNGMDGNGR